jgi:hypothetical protein
VQSTALEFPRPGVSTALRDLIEEGRGHNGACRSPICLHRIPGYFGGNVTGGGPYAVGGGTVRGRRRAVVDSWRRPVDDRRAVIVGGGRSAIASPAGAAIQEVNIEVGTAIERNEKAGAGLRTKIVLPVCFRLESRAWARLRAWPGRNDAIVSPRSTSLNEIGHLPPHADRLCCRLNTLPKILIRGKRLCSTVIFAPSWRALCQPLP